MNVQGTEQIFKAIFGVAGQLDTAFTFLLLVARFAGMMLFLPGISAGARGLAVRYPVILVLAFASMYSTTIVPLPKNEWLFGGMILSEVIFGSVLGAIPMLIIACAQNAGQMASTSMGLQAAALMDPSLGTQVAEVSRIFGDLCIIAFLYTGGHHVVIYATSGLAGKIVPGTFLLNESVLELLSKRSSEIFLFGILLASPIVVAILLTNIVMGLISKVVPTVNIFIVSYPLTIGIGMILARLMLPEFLKAFEPLLTSIESSVSVVTQAATLK